MLSKIISFGLLGLSGYPVFVETDISSGMPAYETVGLPGAAVRESKERVRAALKNSGFDYPQQRITINLAPADTKKQGPIYDLAIAVGLLSASQQAGAPDGKSVFFGRAFAGRAVKKRCGDIADGDFRKRSGIRKTFYTQR